MTAPAAASPDVLPAHVLYGRLLATAAREALDGRFTARARVRLQDGRLKPLPLDVWVGPVTAADEAVAAEAAGPVIDVGCGPGRLLAALEARGKAALGLDLSPLAVALARSRGGRAVIGDVFAEVPGAGEYATAVLLDGNVGIGGCPTALLMRVAAVLRQGGEIAVEVEPPGVPTRRERLRIEAAGAVSDWFRWAWVGVDGVAAPAAAAGLTVDRVREVDGRWFAWLSRGR